MSKKSQRERDEQIKSMAGIGPALEARSVMAKRPTRAAPRQPMSLLDKIALGVTVAVIAGILLAKFLH